MDSDKIFNLQLTIQKLQEEVTLYRNGTNGAELFELINEKDTEIENLKKAAISNKEIYRNIGKGSKDLITKHDNLRNENEVLQIEHSDLIQEKKALIVIVDDLKCYLASAEGRYLEKNVIIGHLEEELHSMEEGIEKLQSRCALLVQENSENKKKLGEKNERIKEQMVNHFRIICL
jgi:chromosome segregation ATPase